MFAAPSAPNIRSNDSTIQVSSLPHFLQLRVTLHADQDE
jgi:hypothetical protein